MKATHYGTCQVCESRQKLPKGRMAKHGYTVAHGWFEGTCFGSDHLPFEQSKDLIDESIARANDRKAHWQQQIAVTQATTGTSSWRHIYHRELSSRTRGSVYMWHFGEFFISENAVMSFRWADRDHIREEIVHDFRMPAQLALEGRQQYIAHCRSVINEIERYILRQQERIREWAPRELTPVAPEENDGPLMHFYSAHRRGKLCAASAMGALKGATSGRPEHVTCPKCLSHPRFPKENA